MCEWRVNVWRFYWLRPPAARAHALMFVPCPFCCPVAMATWINWQTGDVPRGWRAWHSRRTGSNVRVKRSERSARSNADALGQSDASSARLLGELKRLCCVFQLKNRTTKHCRIQKTTSETLGTSSSSSSSSCSSSSSSYTRHLHFHSTGCSLITHESLLSCSALPSI